MSDMIHLMQQGGLAMIPLLLGSILTVAVVLERFWRLAPLERGGDAFRAQLREMLSAGRQAEAIEWLRPKRGPVAATALAGLLNLDGDTETAMAGAARRAALPLNRYLGILETAITAAPLVGLLGTITGMMGVFRVVAQRLAQDPRADTSHLTAGIGEALVATAFGILIAVIAVVFHNLFTGWIDELQDESELVASELLQARKS